MTTKYGQRARHYEKFKLPMILPELHNLVKKMRQAHRQKDL